MTTSVSIPGASFASTALTDPERAEIRRHCGYQPYGPGAAGFIGYRFFQAYGVLEYKMTNARPEELQNMRYRLSVLAQVETALDGMYSTLNVASAGPFTRNKNELRDRKAHFNSLRRALCDVVGIPPGPDLGDGSLSLVV